VKGGAFERAGRNFLAAWRSYSTVDINAPPLVPIEVETDLKKYSKINNALHFAGLRDLRAKISLCFYYRIVSTMLFFCK